MTGETFGGDSETDGYDVWSVAVAVQRQGFKSSGEHIISENFPVKVVQVSQKKMVCWNYVTK